MRVGVVSDSHGYTGRLSTLLMAMEAEGPLDALIHLGDGYHDLAGLGVMLPPVYQVAGNCDLGRSDTRALIELSNARLLLTHGHCQQVKQGQDTLFALALEEGVHAALYGHTHRQRMEWRSGVLLLNPGCAMHGEYAVLTIHHLGGIQARLFGG